MEMKSPVCAPILTMQKVEGERLLIGNGSSVELYKWDENKIVLQQRMPIFEERGCNLYQLNYLHERDLLIAYGETLLATVYHFCSSAPQKKVFAFKIWIQALHVFSKQQEGEDLLEVATLSINNTLHHLRLQSLGRNSDVFIEELTAVQPDYKAVILHSILDGDSWSNLRVIVGTVLGDIIITYPSKPNVTTHVLRHHTGMIFSSMVKNNILLSLSDDRSLRMWSLIDGRHLDHCYGHSSRPYAICDGPEDLIFTGAQDGSIYTWHVGNASLSLLKIVFTGRGVVRSVLFMSGRLFFGTYCGFFGSVPVPSNVKVIQGVNVIYPNLSVQSFVALSQRHYFILDSDGVLYETNTDSIKVIMRCKSFRFDSLKLSPCRKCIALSAEKDLHLIRFSGKGHACGVYHASDQILDLLWSGNCLLLTLFSFEYVLVSLTKDLSAWNSCVLQANFSEIVSCITSHVDQLYLGTRKGSLIVVDGFKVKQYIKRVHSKKSVTDVKLYDSKLLSIGRDGKLRVWVIGSQLQLLSCCRLSLVVEMEWPCKFIEVQNQLYVAGFHGRNFMMVNYHSGHCVCDIACGGGHRAWQLSFPDENLICGDAISLCFEFVYKSRISRIVTSINNLDIIKPHLHLSGITSIVTLKFNGEEFYVTGGIDGMVVMFKLGNLGLIEIKQRISVHTSSVHCLFEKDEYLVSVGGKSEIFVWRLEGENLRQIYSTRLKEDCRLLSVWIASVKPCIRFLVSGSDGRLLLYKLGFDLKGSEDCLTLFTSTSCHGIMTKVSCVLLNGDRIACASVSTAGILYVWKISEVLGETDYEMIRVEKCGLSALDLYKENGDLLLGVGSESGTISIFHIKKKWTITKCSNLWHSATCTDLRFCQNSHSVLVISVALDCRLAVFAYSSACQTLIFLQSVLLNISDPSSLTISAEVNDVIKCAAAGTSVCFVNIKATSRFVRYSTAKTEGVEM